MNDNKMQFHYVIVQAVVARLKFEWYLYDEIWLSSTMNFLSSIIEGILNWNELNIKSRTWEKDTKSNKQ